MSLNAIATPAALEPGPLVVRVAVRHQHPQHRQAAQMLGEDGFPRGPRGVARDAAVDHGPATLQTVGGLPLIFQQPQVDMV